MVIAVGAGRAVAGSDVVIVIDRAMPPEKLEVVTRTLGKAVAEMGEDDRVAVISFARSARVEAALQGGSGKLADALGAITYAEGGSVTVGLRAAYDVLSTARGGPRNILLVTERDLDGARAILEKLRTVHVTVRPIAYQTTAAFRSVANPSELRKELLSTSAKLPAPPTLAVILLIDRSGSMTGQKLEQAKELARTTLAMLPPDNIIAVVQFDGGADVVVRPQKSGNRGMIESAISRIRPGAGTDILGALTESRELMKHIATQVKHVILLTDGQSATDGISELARAMSDEKITLSAVGFPGVDRTWLAQITQLGGGWLYMSEDAGMLPKLFVVPTGPVARY